MSSPAAFNGHRRVPPPVNDPVRSYAPGTPERASLKARLAAMAGETVNIPVIVGGKAIGQGASANVVMPHDHRHVLGTYRQATPEVVQDAIDGRAEGAQGVGRLVVRRSRGGPAQGRRAPDHHVARHDQRRHDARPVEDGFSGRDRFGLRDRRLLPLQRALRPGTARRAAAERSHRRGIRSNIAASKGSSTPSRRSTSRRSPRTCRRRPR